MQVKIRLFPGPGPQSVTSSPAREMTRQIEVQRADRRANGARIGSHHSARMPPPQKIVLQQPESDIFALHCRRGIELIVRYVTSELEMRAGLGGLRSEVRFVEHITEPCSLASKTTPVLR